MPLPGRTSARIKTYGVQYTFSLPSLEDKFRETRHLPKDSKLEQTTSDIGTSMRRSGQKPNPSARSHVAKCSVGT